MIVGYFLEGKTSQDLARFLGVTESRVSQLRSEALRNLKLGIEAQYDAPAATRLRSVGSPSGRRPMQVDQIGEASEWKNRLSPLGR